MAHHNGLSFQTLREANMQRLPQFKNRKGEPAHSKADGSDWKLSAWSNATLGELGEAANIIKKIERGDLTREEALPLLEKELAEVSERVGANVEIGTDNDWHYRWSPAGEGGQPGKAGA